MRWDLIGNMRRGTPLKELKLSTRTYNALRRAGFQTIEEILRLSDEEILGIRNIGMKCFRELKEKLARWRSQQPLITFPLLPIYLIQNLPDDLISYLECKGIFLVGQILQLDDLALFALGLTDKEIALLRRCVNRPLLQPLPELPNETSGAPLHPLLEIAEGLEDLKLPSEVLHSLKRVGLVDLEMVRMALVCARLRRCEPYWAVELLNYLESQHPLKALKLPARVYNALRRAGLKRVEEVARLSDKELLKVRGLGQKGLQILRERIEGWHGCINAAESSARKQAEEYVQKMEERPGPSEVEPKLPLSPEAYWDMLTKGLTQRKRDILIRRFGLETGEPQTLEEIGIVIGRTRERVRQIEKRALQLLKRRVKKPAFAFWREWLLYHLQEAGGVISVEELASRMQEEDITFTRFHPLGFARFLLTITPGVARVRGLKDVWGLAELPLKQAKAVIKVLRQILSETICPLSWDELWERFTQRWEGPPVPKPFVKACAKVDEKVFQDSANFWVLARWHNSLVAKLMKALRSMGHPIHYFELARMTGESPRKVHACLTHYSDIFVWAGKRGTYGLAEWGLKPPPPYVDALEQILREAGHPLPLSEILSRLERIRPYTRASVTLTLGLEPRFYRTETGEYGLIDWLEEKTSEGEIILSFCPPPLPDPPGRRYTFFESIVVARQVLSEKPTVQGFLERMEAWAQRTSPKSDRYRQNVLLAYYLVGLIPYIRYPRDANRILSCTLPYIEDFDALRLACLETLVRRLARTDELLGLLAVLGPIRIRSLNSIFYGPDHSIDDVKRRLRLLISLRAVSKIGPNYRITNTGMKFALPPEEIQAKLRELRDFLPSQQEVESEEPFILAF